MLVLVLPVEVGATCGLISAGSCEGTKQPSASLAGGKLAAAIIGSVGVKVFFFSLKSPFSKIQNAFICFLLCSGVCRFWTGIGHKCLKTLS